MYKKLKKSYQNTKMIKKVRITKSPIFAFLKTKSRYIRCTCLVFYSKRMHQGFISGVFFVRLVIILIYFFVSFNLYGLKLASQANAN